jgi:hypothetical protein
MFLKKEKESGLEVGVPILMRTQDELSLVIRLNLIREAVEGGIGRDFFPPLLVFFCSGRYARHETSA